ARVYVLRGNAYVQMKELERALADYGRAIELNPKFADAFYFRGQVYRASKDLDRALSDFNQAIALNPRFANYFVHRGEAVRPKGEPDRALADLDKALALAPDNKQAQELKRAMLAQKGAVPPVAGQAGGSASPAQPLITQATRLLAQRKPDDALAAL